MVNTLLVLDKWPRLTLRVLEIAIFLPLGVADDHVLFNTLLALVQITAHMQFSLASEKRLAPNPS